MVRTLRSTRVGVENVGDGTVSGTEGSTGSSMLKFINGPSVMVLPFLYDPEPLLFDR